MTAEPSEAPSEATLKFGRSPWWALVLEGIGLIVLGLIAGILPFIASIAVTLIVGWILMFAGGVRVVSSTVHRGPGWGWSALAGCLALAAGLLLLIRPIAGLLSLTTILGAFFFAHAFLSFFLAATAGRSAGRSTWLIVGGITDLILSGVVFMGLWVGALWLLGLLVAANLVFVGAALVTIGFAWRTHQ